MSRLLWVAASAVLLSGAALAQDAQPKKKPKKKKYYLRAIAIPKPGDKIRGLHSTKSAMLMNLKRRGKPLRVENRTSGREIRFVDVILQNSADGLKVERTYNYVKDHATGRIDRTPTKVMLTWGKNGFEYHAEKGDDAIPPAAKQLLDNEKKRPSGLWDHMIPGKPVPVGKGWRIPSPRVAEGFLLDVKDLVEDDSRCVGRFKRLVRKDGEVMAQIVFDFDLVFSKLWDMECVEPARVGFTMDMFGSPNGKTPRLIVDAVGEVTGEGRLNNPNVPKDVTVEWVLTIEGKTEYRPMRGRF